MITTIVITGGPCAGKTSVIERLKQALNHEAVFVGEAATELFTAGQPLPQPDWSKADWLELQRAITQRQLVLEATAHAEARFTGRRLIICDRALGDNTAYPMGETAVAEAVGDRSSWLRRYQAVFHLESLATAQPERFGQIGNASRYESLPEAQALEYRARAAWENHPCWLFLAGNQTIDRLGAELLRLISNLPETLDGKAA